MRLLRSWILLLFSIPSLLISQNREFINGILLYKNTSVVAANVINNTTQKATITDSNGEFQIPVALGDVIIFSSVQYRIKEVSITEDILQKKRLVIAINEDIEELNEVVITPDQTERFINLVEEEFKGFDYKTDMYSRVRNELLEEGQLEQGLNFISIGKLIARIFSDKTNEQRMTLKPSEVIPQIFEPEFFEKDLKLQDFQVVGFLDYLDEQMKSDDLFSKDQLFQLIDYLVTKSQLYKKQLEENKQSQPD